MANNYPEHPVAHREETAAPLFRLLRQGESCVLVGAASVSKSNFLHFILRSDVQQQYLSAESDRIILVYIDLNRCVEKSEWAYIELILHTLVNECQRKDIDNDLTNSIYEMHKDVVLNQNRLFAQRCLERSVLLLCIKFDLKLVFLIDEADHFFGKSDAQFLSNLRALRDDCKYHLSYVLVTRQPLERIRLERDCETFTELFSRNCIGLKPYGYDDADRVVKQLEVRKEHPLEEKDRELIVRSSGGHPGLLAALYDYWKKSPLNVNMDEYKSFLDDTGVSEECLKLWSSLEEDEQDALFQILSGVQPNQAMLDLLVMKGLVTVADISSPDLFSPVFKQYVLMSINKHISNFSIDEDATTVTVAGRIIRGLSPLEFNLIRLLFQERGKVQTRDDILQALYPDEKLAEGMQDNRVDNLIRRVRKRIEAYPDEPQFIITVRGHGYMLSGVIA